MAGAENTASLLHGLRVLDLSPDRVGAQVSSTLADFGADVIWVEPRGGARLRTDPAFPFLGRGKRSTTIDLSTPDGVATVRDLARSADVVIESFRPGVAERLGIGYDELSSGNPRLVYTSITAFGRKGPWSHLKGYEGVVAALLGLNTSFAGMTEEKRPPFLSVPWCTFAASQAALQGTLAALIERETSQAGQWVETNLAQAVTIHEGASSSWYSYLVRNRWPEAFSGEKSLSGDTPMHHFMFRLLIAQTKDGHWLQFAQNRPRLFTAFLRVLGLERLLTDPKWEGIPLLEDPQLRRELWALLLTAVRERTLAEWEAVFAADHDITGERYRSGAEVLDHPQLVHDDAVIDIDDEERGPVRQPGALCSMSATPARPSTSAPPLADLGAGVGWTAATWGMADGSDRTTAAADGPAAPLAGITILELAIQYAAPYSTTLLADLGARVIKIEPLTGDPIRRQIPQFPELGGGKVMQGKQSVALDLTTPEGVAVVQQLAARVDAVVEGFREGAAERRMVDAHTLREINPGLVYLNARGYGAGGPFGDRAAFAPSFGAAGGIAAAHLGGLRELDPMLPIERVAAGSAVLRSASATRYASADGIGALCAANSVLLGVLGQRRGLGGQRIVSSMLLSTAHAMASDVVAFPGSAAPLDPGPELRGAHPLYRIYDAADGWVFLAAPLVREWPALAAALSAHVELAADPRFCDPAVRATHAGELVEVLAEVFVLRGKAEWQRELTAVDIACVAVHTGEPEDVLMTDEFGRAAGYVTDVSHPVFDVHPRLAPIVRFSRSQVDARGGGLCGADTEDVLHELGYSDTELTDLRHKGVIA